MHIIRDTSERASVERLHSDLAAIVESSDDAIIGLSSEGTITSWNVGAEKIFGYSRDEAIGESIGGLTPPGRGDEETDILLQLGRGNGAYHVETVRIGKTGTPIDLSVTVSPIRTADDRILGASVIARHPGPEGDRGNPDAPGTVPRREPAPESSGSVATGASSMRTRPVASS